jgi:hypothetical protein
MTFIIVKTPVVIWAIVFVDPKVFFDVVVMQIIPVSVQGQWMDGWMDVQTDRQRDSQTDRHTARQVVLNNWHNTPLKFQNFHVNVV